MPQDPKIQVLRQSLKAAAFWLEAPTALYLPAKDRQSAVKKLKLLIKKLETQ